MYFHYAAPSRDEVKEGVELYLYSPFVPSWAVVGRFFLQAWRT